MKVAYFFKGKPENLSLFPKDMSIVPVATPLDNGPYPEEQMRAIADLHAIADDGGANMRTRTNHHIIANDALLDQNISADL